MKISASKVRRARRLAEDIPAFVDSLDQLQSGARLGLTTGIPRLDHFLGGWMRSDLYLIAARSSVGKTSAMLNFSKAIFDVPHGIISAEQPARQLLQRLCALIGEVNAQRIRLGQLDENEWRSVSSALAAVSKAPIFIEDSSNIRIDEVARIARVWKQREGIKALFVDYAQRIRARRGDSRVAEVGEVARGLKDIGRELDIPVIALAQLNRNADKRESGKPILSDLRESAELETEADGVIAIYRPSAYDDTIEDKRKTELIILKNRHGPLGYTEVEFYHEFMRFAPYADSPYAGSQREAFLK
jgi:replicative DNA helicase